MANYFYGPYNFLKKPTTVQNKQPALLCPQCGSQRIQQMLTPLVNPETQRPILAPEWLIPLSLITGVAACMLIALGNWWSISGALIELGVFYLIMTKLPLAFRAREQQAIQFCCEQCGLQWQKECPL
jgi:predicted RNA-binding Zn-ribbon protein involved in translation (DUF1610 family)